MTVQNAFERIEKRLAAIGMDDPTLPVRRPLFKTLRSYIACHLDRRTRERPIVQASACVGGGNVLVPVSRHHPAIRVAVGRTIRQCRLDCFLLDFSPEL